MCYTISNVRAIERILLKGEIMIYFNSDYTEGAHERILSKLVETNYCQTAGYGEDEFCDDAREKIKKACNAPEAVVHFLVGGTQTNATVIASLLKPYQGALCADCGHINVHETGAVEHTGHKVIALPSKNGKITAEQVKEKAVLHKIDGAFEHIVQPKLVYLSQSTEYGTLYTLAELEAIAKVCQEENLYLFVDGARLGYGLMAEDNDVTLADLARLCDAFYIGGTKVGALFGEAIVFKNKSICPDFRYYIKQNGGMLAKGRLLGVQFGVLFEDELYFKLGAHADRLADEIRACLDSLSIPYLIENKTNQIFPVFPDDKLAILNEQFVFSYTERVDATHSCVRICTSWATKKENVDTLISSLKRVFA